MFQGGNKFVVTMPKLLSRRPSKKQKAQGTGPTKRTPKGDYDGAAGKDIYLVEDILAESRSLGAPQFLLRWQGLTERDDTWEPLENLAGMEEHIAMFRQKQREKNEEAIRVAEEARRARLQNNAASCRSGDSAGGSTETNVAPAAEHGQAQQRKKRSKVWKYFNEVLDEEGKITAVQCTVVGCTCPPLQWCGTTSNLRNHMASAHKDDFIEMTKDGTGECQCL